MGKGLVREVQTREMECISLSLQGNGGKMQVAETAGFELPTYDAQVHDVTH